MNKHWIYIKKIYNIKGVDEFDLRKDISAEENCAGEQHKSKEKRSSKKLMFLHGSKRDWIRIKRNQNELDVDNDQEELKEVKDSSWNYADDVPSSKSNEHWNNTVWTVLRGALERVERISEEEKKFEAMIHCQDGQDVMDLLFSAGSVQWIHYLF